jgi:tellurite resistance protein TerC
MADPLMKDGGLLRRARRAVVAVIGGTLLLVGVAMLVLPGPALIVIPAALALLATEFVWARRLLRRVRDGFRRRPS